jgi:hypothetical protein
MDDLTSAPVDRGARREPPGTVAAPASIDRIDALT